MYNDYGINRTLGAKDALPVLAWSLDNKKVIYDNELLLHVTDIHLEAANFKQICNEASNDPNLIKEKIMELVNIRGKLHNPYTGTGGLIAGTVERIGSEYRNEKNIVIGDKVLVLVSATMIPLKIEEILEIDFVFGNIKVRGHGILFNRCAIIKRPDAMPLNLLMVAFEESASIYHIHQLSEGKKDFLVIGSNVIHILLYGYAIRKAIGKSGHISALIFEPAEATPNIESGKTRGVLGTVFDKMYHVNTPHPVDISETITKNHPGLFDVSINCADMRGTEAINVLTTKEKGTVFFSSLINNYNIAVFLTEGIGKELNILCSDGYVKDYDVFTLGLLAEMKDLLQQISEKLYISYESTKRIQNLNFDSSSDENIPVHLLHDFIASSKIMNSLMKDIIKASKYDCTVLITGETGVGKEKLAQVIHRLSNRNMQTCVKINCASIPKELMESEFFGYEPGAFTGASAKGKTGYFEQADKGILLLDEISELPLGLQAKLLRVIQDNEFYPVGAEKPVKVDVRIVAATNRNIKQLIEQGLFREDLYYRLAVLTLHIPPLRKRKQDIVPLLDFILKKYNNKFGLEKRIKDEGVQYLVEYDWPGNVREMENLIQRLLIYSENPTITELDVMKELGRADMPETGDESSDQSLPKLSLDQIDFRKTVENYEKELLAYALSTHRTTRKAAEAFGMTQAQFMRKKKKYGI